ncbi:Protein MON2 [Portunus trituberculatus]|uniref:Protein MON2 n=1 Tax=Portunus trituberculatus TaxID=210409 RepID=A0A5B7HVC9_PORTR|nr:Protein MON2 [Portunus trituberculatus]
MLHHVARPENLTFSFLLFSSGISTTEEEVEEHINLEELKVLSANSPKTLHPAAADAYLMFQDLVQLVNADQPLWLLGLTEMTRTFGLELLESVLTTFPTVFYNVTQCEIFLSLMVKFLDGDRPMWQRGLALEVLHRLATQPNLLQSFCTNYDMKPHATKIFQVK